MAERDQVTRPFGSLDGGNSCDADDVAFFAVARLNPGQGFGLHADAACGPGEARAFLLAANVHHVGLASGIEVGEGVVHAELRLLTKLARCLGWGALS